MVSLKGKKQKQNGDYNEGRSIKEVSRKEKYISANEITIPDEKWLFD